MFVNYKYNNLPEIDSYDCALPSYKSYCGFVGIPTYDRGAQPDRHDHDHLGGTVLSIFFHLVNSFRPMSLGLQFFIGQMFV
jgi:hypothetical protein